MSTNYYAKTNVCEHCNRFDELHIGKSSAGWCFSLHVIPERGLNTWDDWKSLLSLPSTSIRDEYDNDVLFCGLEDTVTNRACGEKGPCPTGYESWAHFHSVNESEYGPNGLFRARIGDHCIGHGEGTWDYIPGEFS